MHHQNKFDFLQIQPLTVEFTTPVTRIFELKYFHGVRLNLKIIAVRFSKSMFLDYLGHGLSVGELSLPLKYLKFLSQSSKQTKKKTKSIKITKIDRKQNF